METWLYSDINRACRDVDRIKVQTLGPFLKQLWSLIQTNREYDCLYRGLVMDAEDFQQIKENEDIWLPDINSCSVDLRVAKGYAKTNDL